MKNHEEKQNESLMSTLLKNREIYSPNSMYAPNKCLCGNDFGSTAQKRKEPKGERLVAYIRATNEVDIEKFLLEIQKYCTEHSYQIVQIFTDLTDHPSFGLQAALTALENADGLISCDINMFVNQQADRVRELRPFIHQFFCLDAKHLITIVDGIDTGTVLGQENAITLMCESKDGFYT